MTTSWDASVFDQIYARAPDPWSVDTSPYEREKYDTTLAALPAPRFTNALEIGCSIGAQTTRLAERCDALLAVDVSAEAIRRARERCADLANVQVREARIPQDWPPGTFDLIVISEVLYFFSRADIAETAQRATASLAPGGAIVLVNWTGYTDTPTTGAEAAELFVRGAALTRALDLQREKYRVDLLSKE
jgi:SAM-dependent methyltransferase